MRTLLDIIRLKPNDRHWEILCRTLWRDYYALYTEKYNKTPQLDEEGNPIDPWVKNTISPDINHGLAIGQANIIEGNRSIAIGQGNNTTSFMELLLGAYGTIAEGQDPAAWVATDRLAALGNGTDADHRSLAFEVFKSGLVKLGNALKIGKYVHGEVDPEDWTLSLEDDGLSYWLDDEWHLIGSGASAYVYKAYASDAAGTGFTLIQNPALRFIAFLKSTIEIPVPVVTDFAGLWYNVDGKHNDNTEKQGGDAVKDEYYHLSRSQVDELVTKDTPIVKIDEGETEIDVIYGYLYNLQTATDARNIAPAGWRVATWDDAVATQLVLDPSGDTSANIAGGHLKESGTENWNAPNMGADNSSGFNAIPSGMRSAYDGGNFNNFGINFYFWIVLPGLPSEAVIVGLFADSSLMSFGGIEPNAGCSIRLVKEDGVDPGSVLVDGISYPTVKIGNLVWSAKSIMAEHFSNGDPILEIQDNSAWLAATSAARCSFANNSTNAGIIAPKTTDVKLGGTIKIPSKITDIATADVDYLTPVTAATTYAPILVLTDIETILASI